MLLQAQSFREKQVEEDAQGCEHDVVVMTLTINVGGGMGCKTARPPLACLAHVRSPWTMDRNRKRSTVCKEIQPEQIRARDKAPDAPDAKAPWRRVFIICYHLPVMVSKDLDTG